MDSLMESVKILAINRAVPILYEIGGAILLWVVGRIAIGAIRRGVHISLERRKFDPTLIRYIESVASVTLTILLVLAVLSIFGVETTSFAALLAAAGIAIGTAWSGLLANFAAGVFLILLRPFRVGDQICGAGITGVVHEVGLFATTVDTADNLRVFVGNNKLFGDNIINYSTNPSRRVDLTAQLPGGVDPREAIRLLSERLPKVANVLQTPAPSVEILEFTRLGPVLAVRPFCHPTKYWDVYFATNQMIYEAFSSAGYPAPMEQVLLQQRPAERN